MKYLIVLLIAFSFQLHAQDSTKVKAPRLFMEQEMHKPIIVNDVSVTLKKVLNDSRCPIDVNCIRAGEAKIIVEIVKGGEIRKVKEVIIEVNPTGDYNGLIYTDKFTTIYAIDLLPYPENNVKTETYFLKVEAKKTN